ncbi:IS4 family transposase (plasmid) [Embleya sp. NBC_00888]|uniref:IS4 family transposase n=1 Tax=Embleya sp. NBC_00888 TaxID=2975960 RepID=UPI002F90C07B|nr:IS4 family transposase [Embleya sp. NBC_00888]
MLISRLERLGLGVLTQSCPPELVDRVVGEAGRQEKRRRLLSARFTVYFVLAMCLFPQADYLEVLRLVKSGDRGLRSWPGVNKSSLTRARKRLGWRVMQELFRTVARPLGGDAELFHGMRVLALDGTLLAVPDSVSNNETFGKSGSQRSPMGYPQARVVAIAECSSHAVLDAVIGGFKDSERIVSDALDAHTGTGTLLLADRGLWGLVRWHRLREQGTHLLWRIERRKARRVQDVLPDGSYLARIEANKHSKASGTVKAPPALVRVIEYRVDGQPDIVRLITSLTDHERYPAAELAVLHARRWEIELVFDEIKTHQRGRPVLRSQTPDGVRQEIYAHLVVHHATRHLLDEAARLNSTTAERTSFTRALHLVRRTVISPGGFSPLGPQTGPKPRTYRNRPRPASRAAVTGLSPQDPFLRHRLRQQSPWGSSQPSPPAHRSRAEPPLA